jgi:hypothetical protein
MLTTIVNREITEIKGEVYHLTGEVIRLNEEVILLKGIIKNASVLREVPEITTAETILIIETLKSEKNRVIR